MVVCVVVFFLGGLSLFQSLSSLPCLEETWLGGESPGTGTMIVFQKMQCCSFTCSPNRQATPLLELNVDFRKATKVKQPLK